MGTIGASGRGPSGATHGNGLVISLVAANVSGADPRMDLCQVCTRAVMWADHRFTWLACERCRGIDGRVARALGGKQFFPLGRHSIMNGGAVSSVAPPVIVQASVEGLVTLVGTWDRLRVWRRAEVERLWMRAAFARVPSVPWPEWEAAFPASAQASADAYRRLLVDQHAWLAEAEPHLVDLQWLLGDDNGRPRRTT